MSMGASKFRGLCRVLGLWVKPRQREIAKHQTKLPAEMFLHGFDDGISGAANRALIVAIFDQGDGSIRVALDVIGRTDRNLQSSYGRSSMWQLLEGLKYAVGAWVDADGERWLQVMMPLRSITKSARSQKPSVWR